MKVRGRRSAQRASYLEMVAHTAFSYGVWAVVSLASRFITARTYSAIVIGGYALGLATDSSNRHTLVWLSSPAENGE